MTGFSVPFLCPTTCLVRSALCRLPPLKLATAHLVELSKMATVPVAMLQPKWGADYLVEFLGKPHLHYTIHAATGLDCSNLLTWVQK